MIAPRLPADWPSLAITRIHLRRHVLDIAARGNEIEVTDRAPHGSDGPALKIQTPPGWTLSTRRD